MDDRITIGSKVRTPYGKIETVSRIEDKRLFTTESQNSWYHPSKVFPVFWSQRHKKYFSVPND